MEKVNPIEVLNTLDGAIERLEKNYNPNLLNDEELKIVDEKFEDIIKLALKVKLQYQQRRMNDLMNALDNDKNVDVDKIQVTSDAIGKALDLIAA
jgi:hypothetical protein